MDIAALLISNFLFLILNTLNDFSFKSFSSISISLNKLASKLLNSYEGNIIISIGNYDNLTHSCPNYLSELNINYDLQKRIILKMPWGLEEKIEIYLKKNI